MNLSPIYLSRYDHQRLAGLLAPADARGRWRELHAELQRAIVLPAHARVPNYVITVGTHVAIQDLDTLELQELVLTLPGEPVFGTATPVDVTDPLGTALLGCMQGDIVNVPSGDGRRQRVRITRVLQSAVAEAAATLAGA